jgi:ubiquinone/menaquinone biosynthesis C-methylase UbiE
MAVKFDKYDKSGAIHWKQTNKLSVIYNAPLVSRYNSVIRHLPRNAKSALDIGCGDGRLTCLIAGALPNAIVTGIDSEPVGIDIASREKSARGIGNVTFGVNDKDELPFKSQSLDLVVLTDVIEHLTRPDKLLGEIARILKEDGSAIITTPNRQVGTKWDNRHEQEFSGPELEQTVARHFGKVEVFGSWPMENVRAWKAKGVARIALDLQARFGRNRFDSEVRNPTSDWGQLTVVSSAPVVKS